MSKITMVFVGWLVGFLIAPLLTIWALNTVFPILAIPYALETWAAVILLRGFIHGYKLKFQVKD